MGASETRKRGCLLCDFTVISSLAKDNVTISATEGDREQQISAAILQV